MEKLNELPQAFYGVIQSGKVVMLPADDGQWLNKTSVAEAFRELGRTSDTNMAAAQAMRDDMHRWKQRAEAAEAKLATERQDKIIPEGLNRYTAELVLDFAKAIAEKLHQSERKYGWSDGWKESDWQEKCLADFHHHIGKGDPRDVAAYCAFMWHHEWPTRPAPAADLAELVPDKMTADGVISMRDCGVVEEWNDCCNAILRNIEEAE